MNETKWQELKDASDYALHNGGSVQVGHKDLNDLLEAWKALHHQLNVTPIPPPDVEPDGGAQQTPVIQ